MENNTIRTYSKNNSLVRERRRKIGNTAAHLFIKNGYATTSMREIADSCNISIGALYHYIGGKEDILYLIIDAAYLTVKELSREILTKRDSCSATKSVRITIQKYLKHVDDYQDQIVLWYRETKNLKDNARKLLFEMEDHLVSLFEELLIEGCSQGEFIVTDFTLAAHNIVVLCDMWAFRRWALRKKYTLNQYIIQQTEIMLNSICRKKGNM